MTEYPRIRRREASEQLLLQDFVLRRGRQGPVLTVADTHGCPVHVPLRVDAETQRLQLTPPRTLLGQPRVPALQPFVGHAPMTPCALSDALMEALGTSSDDGRHYSDADIAHALSQADMRALGELLSRGQLQASDPRLLDLDGDVASKLVLHCAEQGFLTQSLRLIRRNFPPFPADVDESQYTAARKLIDAMDTEPTDVAHALLSAPEALRTHLSQSVLRDKLPKMMVKLVTRVQTRPLARKLFMLPGMNWNGLQWSALPRNRNIRKALTACGAPSSVAARLRALRPHAKWSISLPAPSSVPELAQWMVDVAPRIKFCIVFRAHREQLDNPTDKSIRRIVRSLDRWETEWTGNVIIQFAGERGVDGGGLMSEWLRKMTAALFDPARGAFVQTGSGPQFALATDRFDSAWLDHVLLAGRLIGKCLTTGTPAGIVLPRTYLAMLTGRIPTVEMVLESQPHMQWLHDLLARNIEGDSGLTFQMPDGTLLTPGGDDIAVTESNKRAFARLVCDYLPDGGEFLKGVFDVVPPSVLSHLDPQALGRIISGEQHIDVEAWIDSIEIDGDEMREAREPVWFKDLLRIYAQTRPEDLSKLLNICTNLTGPPAGGFDYLYPPFTLHIADFEGIPLAHTCDHSIDLPHCKSPSDLHAKMEYFLTQDLTYRLK